MLILLLTIASSGLLILLFFRIDINAVQNYFVGLTNLEISSLPASPLLVLHLILVALLLIIFPYSKLLHAPGVFFSPTRNQVDNPRERPYRTSLSRPQGGTTDSKHG